MFQERMRLLEGAQACFATATGIAVFVALATLLGDGDRDVSSRSLFGSCFVILDEILPRWGVETVFVYRGGDLAVTQAGPVRLVATDLDGTLLRSDGVCSPRMQTALSEVERAGIQVVLVTARPPRWQCDLADLVGAHGGLCCNGAFVNDVRSRQVLR